MGRIYDIETVLQTARLAMEAGMDWRWTLAGEDPEDTWVARAAELGLFEVVEFPGYVIGEELEALKVSADLGLVPMNPNSKVAVPYKLGEYCLAGLAVVHSLPGEAQDLLGQEGTGVFYEYGNPESLLEALRGLAEDPERLAEMKAASRRLGRAVFDRKKTYPAFVTWLVGS
jgi:glycosyltransferase involved in cell wall biosynthesis